MSLQDLEHELTDAVERLRRSVVALRAPRVRGGPGEIGEAAGSGVLVDPDGFLVTNHHVVDGARGLRVRFDGGRELPGEVLGSDPATDLAVVRVPGHDLPAARFADSERLRVGQFAFALGNSLGLPGGPTVSLGVISATGRPLPGADYVLEGPLQTDAAINPGNSGGPLANLSGEVLGINTAMMPFAQGVGFALPSNTVRSIVEQIRSSGRVHRPWLGISAVTVSPALARRERLPTEQGVLVAGVDRAGPAAASGIRAGDVLRQIGERPIGSLRELLAALARLPVGGAVDFEYLREGRVRRGVLRIAEAPPALAAG
jgi:serine protease Do